MSGPAIPDSVFSALNQATQQCRAIAKEAAERHDLEAESQASEAAHAIEMSMASVPAVSLASLAAKARVARAYIERTDGLPEDSLDRLWLSIANDIERLVGGA